MKAVYALVTVLAVSVALVACGGGGAEKPASSAPASGAPAAGAPAAAGEPGTGVAECDEYIKKYEACISAKVPEAGRAAMKQGFEAQRASFKQAASTDAGKSSLPGVCKQAMDTAKAATAAYGCSW